MDNAKAVLLLGHSKWQQRAIELALKLVGHDVRVVKEVDEAINLIKSTPEMVHGVVLAGGGCQATLRERLAAFNDNRVTKPIYLLGSSLKDLENNKIFPADGSQLKLSCCSNDQLLEVMGQ